MILVTGSTGTIGATLVRRLAESGQRVRAIVRPGEPDAWPAQLGIERSTVDFDDPDGLAAAARGADRVFMLVPPSANQERWQANIVAAAQAANAGYVVKVSAFDTGATSALTMGRWHHAGERLLARSGIPHTILRPQYFMQNLLASPSIVSAATLPTYIEPSTPVGMIDAADVASVAAALLAGTAPVPSERVLVPTGPRPVSPQQFAGELARALARPIKVRYLEPEVARPVLSSRGLPDWHVEDVLHICATASSLVTDCVPRVTGRNARDIAILADDFADAVLGVVSAPTSTPREARLR